MDIFSKGWVRLPVLALVLLLSLMPNDGAYGDLPGLRLPDWIGVQVSLSGTPEVDRPFSVTGTVEVLIGELKAAPYAFHLPDGLKVISGVRQGELTLKQGESRRIELRCQLSKAAPDASLTLEVEAPYPIKALTAEIDSRFEKEEDYEVGSLKRHLDSLKGSHIFSAMEPFSAREEEGFDGHEEEAFTYYFRSTETSDARFAMLGGQVTPPPGGWKGSREKESARDLLNRNPRLAELLQKAGKSPEMLIEEDDRQTYSLALEELKSGQQVEALKRFRSLAAVTSAGSTIQFAATNGEAVALFASGESSQAEAIWNRLGRSDSPLSRYAHFNFGEALRARGDRTAAETEYKQALKLNQAYTLARRRLSER